jgi:SAM-dependent methyltransferase
VKNLLLSALGRLRLQGPAYRAYESVASLRAVGRHPPAADDGLPVPPPRLIVRVAGTPDARWFLESGRAAATAIRTALERAGRQIDELDSILDFGCGCGRVTRRWVGLHGVDVRGSDRNAAAIAWCRANLGFARFETNELAPPLPHASGTFDLVYALSVFTHLTSELGLAWAEELARVLRPGGYVLLTTHGARYREKLAPAERASFDASELVVRRPEAVGSNLCAAFHPRAYVQETLAQAGPLEPVEFVPEGATGNPHQDLHLLRKP